MLKIQFIFPNTLISKKIYHAQATKYPKQLHNLIVMQPLNIDMQPFNIPLHPFHERSLFKRIKCFSSLVFKKCCNSLDMQSYSSYKKNEHILFNQGQHVQSS